MDFIKPKKVLDQKNDWKLSKRVKTIVSLYSEYTGYSENEVVDTFFNNLLKDSDFIEWLNSRRFKKRIEGILKEDDQKVDEGDTDNVQL